MARFSETWFISPFNTVSLLLPGGDVTVRNVLEGDQGIQSLEMHVYSTSMKGTKSVEYALDAVLAHLVGCQAMK